MDKKVPLNLGSYLVVRSVDRNSGYGLRSYHGGGLRLQISSLFLLHPIYPPRPSILANKKWELPRGCQILGHDPITLLPVQTPLFQTPPALCVVFRIQEWCHYNSILHPVELLNHYSSCHSCYLYNAHMQCYIVAHSFCISHFSILLPRPEQLQWIIWRSVFVTTLHVQNWKTAV